MEKRFEYISENGNDGVLKSENQIVAKTFYSKRLDQIKVFDPYFGVHIGRLSFNRKENRYVFIRRT